jgi:hypothetical protein
VGFRLVADPDEVGAPGAQDMPQATGAAPEQLREVIYGHRTDIYEVQVVHDPGAG